MIIRQWNTESMDFGWCLQVCQPETQAAVKLQKWNWLDYFGEGRVLNRIDNGVMRLFPFLARQY